MSDRPTYRIDLVPAAGVVGDQSVRALRAMLKVMGRAYGLRCVRAVRVDDDGEELPPGGENS